jgi:hypothetical protein
MASVRRRLASRRLDAHLARWPRRLSSDGKNIFHPSWNSKDIVFGAWMLCIKCRPAKQNALWRGVMGMLAHDLTRIHRNLLLDHLA